MLRTRLLIIAEGALSAVRVLDNGDKETAMAILDLIGKCAVSAREVEDGNVIPFPLKFPDGAA